MKVRPGASALLEAGSGLRAGDRVALVANQASVLPDLTHLAVVLNERRDVELVRIFAPEHGLWGDAQDHATIQDETDPVTGLPIVSLYGTSEASLRPPAGALDDVDVVVFDLQDIGTRYYTFLATLRFVMEACATAGVRVVVTDRPNPIGGMAVEGPPLEAGWESFVGAFPVPVRHGLTAGEMAGFFRGELGIDCELEVLEAEGWTRDMHFDDTGLPWVAPSPNMPTPDTALVYPGLCLVEATNLSEGRGTTRPFEWIGAPYLDPFRFARELGERGLPGVRFRPLYFLPTHQKWAHQRCGGVQLHVTDAAAFRPFATGMHLLDVAHRLGGAAFDWRREAYEFVADRLAIDLLYGSDRGRTALERGEGLAGIESEWQQNATAFEQRSRRYHLYPNR